MRYAFAAGTVLLRETLRALLVPVRCLLFLPTRHRHLEAARTALTGPRFHPEDDGLQGFFATAPRPAPSRPHVLLSAGEASGEAHAVHLMREVRRCGDVRWTCLGGAPMAAEAGTPLLFPLSEHAIMGVLGVLRSLPVILRAFTRYLRSLDRDRPDLVVLVDYPGLHLVMAEAARRRGIPVLHYVAPQYWAWAPWRMRRYRRAVRGTLTILPFEPAFFRAAGIPSRYVGHPLLDGTGREPDRGAVAAVRARRTLVLLPGSRRAEIERHLPGMVATARRLLVEDPELRAVVVHRDPRRAALVRQRLAGLDAGFVEVAEGEPAPWLAGAHLVLAKSGTGSLEAVLHGAPTVVVYVLRGPVSSWFHRHMLTVPWIASTNLIAGRPVLPELVFRGPAGWDEVLAAARRLWWSGPGRESCLEGVAGVRRTLGGPGASRRAAAVVAGFLGLPTTPT